MRSIAKELVSYRKELAENRAAAEKICSEEDQSRLKQWVGLALRQYAFHVYRTQSSYLPLTFLHAFE
jgi:hypothetical protein